MQEIKENSPLMQFESFDVSVDKEFGRRRRKKYLKHCGRKSGGESWEKVKVLDFHPNPNQGHNESK